MTYTQLKSKATKTLVATLTTIMAAGPFMPATEMLVQASGQSEETVEVQAQNETTLNEGLANPWGTSEVDYDSFMAMITELEQFIHVEDGHLVFEQVPFGIQMKYGFDTVSELFEGASALNDLVDNGDYLILEDLTVIDLNAPRTARNNINQSFQRWWGIEQWMTTARARDFANAMNNVAAGYALAGGLAVFIPGIGWAAGAAGGLGNIWYSNMARNVTNRAAQSNGRGIVVYMHWGFTYTTRVQ